MQLWVFLFLIVVYLWNCKRKIHENLIFHKFLIFFVKCEKVITERVLLHFSGIWKLEIALPIKIAEIEIKHGQNFGDRQVCVVIVRGKLRLSDRAMSSKRDGQTRPYHTSWPYPQIQSPASTEEGRFSRQITCLCVGETLFFVPISSPSWILVISASFLFLYPQIRNPRIWICMLVFVC